MEAFAPVQEVYEDLKMSVTVLANETLEQHFGIRRLGNFQQRPDLYGPRDPKERAEALRVNGPGAPTFWRCQNPESQPKPEYSEAMRGANVEGLVMIQVNVDTNGKLVRLRVASQGTKSRSCARSSEGPQSVAIYSDEMAVPVYKPNHVKLRRGRRGPGLSGHNYVRVSIIGARPPAPSTSFKQRCAARYAAPHCGYRRRDPQAQGHTAMTRRILLVFQA